MLHNLETRYQMNMIYSFSGNFKWNQTKNPRTDWLLSGPILIAVNPYQRLPLYANEIISAYCGQPLGTNHITAVAEFDTCFFDRQITTAHLRYCRAILSLDVKWRAKSIYSRLWRVWCWQNGLHQGQYRPQTMYDIIFDTSVQFLLQYFAAMSSKDATGSIEKKVLESTPVLEAFGNAKTLKNDNSSRFGKFIEVQFNERGNICGANLSTYLLEKSRIVRQAEGERNYHFFYQLCAGASPEERQRFYLEEPGFYEFLNKSGCYEIEGVADDESFRRTRVAFDILGITKEEQENIFAIVSAVLRLGNVT